MNLEEVLDPEYGLQQDEWSLTKPTFGDEGQLQVIGWSGRNKTVNGAKYYVLKCMGCLADEDLFGESYFKSTKRHLTEGKLPCGCGRSPRWSISQYSVLCRRKAEELGYIFSGFNGGWSSGQTKIKMICTLHGHWESATIHSLMMGRGCPVCAIGIRVKHAVNRNTIEDNLVIKSLYDTGHFHPKTEFWRSNREDIRGNKTSYWFMHCPECGETGEATKRSLLLGCKSCGCSIHNQKEAYINLIKDFQNQVIALKFGIARNSSQRAKQQNAKSVYELHQYQVYKFPDVASCKKAERECKKELECGVVLKRDMPDGYSETTWVYNLDKIREIYERNGGILD